MNILINALGIQDSGGITVLDKVLDECSRYTLDDYLIVCHDNTNNIEEQFFPDELKNKPYHQFNFKQLFSMILKYDNFLITPSVMAKVAIYKNQIKTWDGERFE